jgi:hypothetical protein
MLYERLRAQWRHQGSMSAIRDFPPRCGPRALSNKPIEIRNPSNGLAEVKGKCQNKSRKSLEKKEVELLKVGALRNDKTPWESCFSRMERGGVCCDGQRGRRPPGEFG